MDVLRSPAIVPSKFSEAEENDASCRREPLLRLLLRGLRRLAGKRRPARPPVPGTTSTSAAAW